jgi:hypothetical protein
MADIQTETKPKHPTIAATPVFAANAALLINKRFGTDLTSESLLEIFAECKGKKKVFDGKEKKAREPRELTGMNLWVSEEKKRLTQEEIDEMSKAAKAIGKNWYLEWCKVKRAEYKAANPQEPKEPKVKKPKVVEPEASEPEEEAEDAEEEEVVEPVKPKPKKGRKGKNNKLE